MGVGYLHSSGLFDLLGSVDQTAALLLTLAASSPASVFLEGLSAWNTARAGCGGDIVCKSVAEDVFRSAVNDAFARNELGVIEPCKDGWGYYTYDTKDGWNQDAPLPCWVPPAVS